MLNVLKFVGGYGRWDFKLYDFRYSTVAAAAAVAASMYSRRGPIFNFCCFFFEETLVYLVGFTLSIFLAIHLYTNIGQAACPLLIRCHRDSISMLAVQVRDNLIVVGIASIVFLCGAFVILSFMHGIA